MSSSTFRTFHSKSAADFRWHSPGNCHTVVTAVTQYLQTLPVLALVFLASTSQVAHTYPQYGKLVPNSDNVPNPCVSTTSNLSDNSDHKWIAVGHVTSEGGGARNPFGIDFSNFGRTWSTALCRQDSDGDGRTNGEELGDPQCVWKPGQQLSSATNITHPGICEPLDSATCVAVRKAQLVAGTAPICPNASVTVASSAGGTQGQGSQQQPEASTSRTLQGQVTTGSTTGSTTRSSTTVLSTPTTQTTAQTTTLPRLTK